MAAEQETEMEPMQESGVDISPDKNGGILKKILKEGEGDEYPGEGSEVFVHYTGTLLSGEKFDSSKDRDQLFSFKLGEGQVIKGWDIGVATMKKGEVAILTCAPEYAYGATGSPPKIPANATLKFEVELHYWKDTDVTNDGGVIKKILIKGEGYKNPKDEANITIHMRGMYQGTAFEEKDIEFILGEGSEKGICMGIEKALYTMKKREKVQLKIQSKYGFGEMGNEKLGIPANAEIVYEVYLTSFENPKESYEMDFDEKIETSQKVKEKGTSFFKAGDYEKALKQYERMIKLLDVYKDEEKAKANPLKCIGHLNAAMCELKLKEYGKARKSCDKALEIESQNVKGLFRRGQANFGLSEYELAKRDFSEVLNIEPKNKAARDQLKSVVMKVKEINDSERKKYSNMFEKFAREDQRKLASEKKAKLEEDVVKKAAEEARQVEKEEQKTAGMEANGAVGDEASEDAAKN